MKKWNRLKKLIELGVILSLEDRSGKNALSFALDSIYPYNSFDLFSERINIVKAMLEQNISTTDHEFGDSILIRMMYFWSKLDESLSFSELANKILDTRPSNLNKVIDSSFGTYTFLTSAVEDVNAAFNNGHFQKVTEMKEVIFKSITYGADKTFRDHNGKTAYDLALKNAWGRDREFLKP